MNAVVTLNPAKSGIEIRFTVKPEPSIIEAMKEHGFRWSGKQKMWYARQDDSRLSFASTIGDFFDNTRKDNENKQEAVNAILDLWGLTRTDSIIDNYAATHLHDTKEIARIIRNHIKQRFPMCRWSIRSDYNSIDVDLLSSPFARDSAELKAIIHYAAKFADSWNYNNSDYMSDYHDVNFYGVHETNILSYDYQQREQTEAEAAICAAFEAALADFEKAEEERRAREYAEYLAEQERIRAEAELANRRREENHKRIENGAIVKDANYFVLNCVTPVCNKLDSVEEIDQNEKKAPEICRVSREVYFEPAVYDLFAKQLLDEYSFLSGMGGHQTDDLRVQSDIDFLKMSKEERESVQWYNTRCIAVFRGDKLALVINPEGHNYARYAYLVDENSVVSKDYKAETGISQEEFEKNRKAADMLEDASREIILENGLTGTWDKENYKNYKAMVREWLYAHRGFTFNAGTVRAIGIDSLKKAMYDILENPVPAKEQFEASGLEAGDRFTLICINDFGMITCTNAVFHSWEVKKYAQYDDNIRLVFKPTGKRNYYEANLHSDFLIYPGYIQIPDDVLWETLESSTPGVTVRHSRFMSCDRAVYDAVIERFKSMGLKPIINTYKPIFS